MSTPIVSVLMPTRGRVDTMQETVASYFEKATAPAQVEMLVRVHEDDAETRAWMDSRDKSIRVVMGDTERGYGSCDHFLNCLAAVSNGDWLWPCADDHRMLTQGWDEVLRQRLPEPRKTPMLLTAKVANWPNGRVPVMSRGLYRALGHMGLTGFADCYVDSLTHFAGLQEISGIEVQDKVLPPVCDRQTMEHWAIYKSAETAHCFEMDKKKLGVVLGKPIKVSWTPLDAPERP